MVIESGFLWILSFLIMEKLGVGAQVFFLFPAWKSVPDSRKIMARFRAGECIYSASEEKLILGQEELYQ
jgi:hypothetical protein